MAVDAIGEPVICVSLDGPSLHQLAGKNALHGDDEEKPPNHAQSAPQQDSRIRAAGAKDGRRSKGVPESLLTEIGEKGKVQSSHFGPMRQEQHDDREEGHGRQSPDGTAKLIVKGLSRFVL